MSFLPALDSLRGATAQVAASSIGGAYERGKEIVSEEGNMWVLRCAAEMHASICSGEMGKDALDNSTIFETSAVASAVHEVNVAVQSHGYGSFVLFGEEGSGLTTTLNAAVRGERYQGSPRFDRAIVFSAGPNRATADEWYNTFLKCLGPSWEGLDGITAAMNLIRCLTCDGPDTVPGAFVQAVMQLDTMPQSYDPAKLPNFAPKIEPIKRAATQQHDYSPGTSFHFNGASTVIGFDDVNFDGGLKGKANDFFNFLSGACKDSRFVMVLATHKASIAEELLTLHCPLKPMITCIAPKVQDLPLPAYDDYVEWLKHRNAYWNDFDNMFEWDGHLRMTKGGEDLYASRTKTLLIKIYSLKENNFEDDSILNKAMKRVTLADRVESARMCFSDYERPRSPTDTDTDTKKTQAGSSGDGIHLSVDTASIPPTQTDETVATTPSARSATDPPGVAFTYADAGGTTQDAET